jgi:hypothetical protein
MRSETSESHFAEETRIRGFLGQRLRHFLLSMLIMMICFPLYYLGFFGTVEGPLNPAEVGTKLACLGVTRAHLEVFSIVWLIVAITWNWIYNLVSFKSGLRLTCLKSLDEKGTFCGAPVKRAKVVSKKTGTAVTRYVCAKGHKRPDAHFHPVAKGTVSHALWVIALAFCVVVLFLS